MNLFPLRTGHTARYSRLLNREHKLEQLALERRRLPARDERTRHVANIASHFGTRINEDEVAATQFSLRRREMHHRCVRSRGNGGSVAGAGGAGPEEGYFQFDLQRAL